LAKHTPPPEEAPATASFCPEGSEAKLGARNRIDAIRLAREAGWL
jgi:hypothetical protein